MKTTPDLSKERYLELQSKLLAQYRTDATSRYLALESPPLKAHLLEVGKEGEPVVLLHGGGAVAVSLEPLLSLLQHRFRLFVPDRPGCGLTDKIDYRGVSFQEHAIQFVKSLVDALDLQKAAFVGNSMGGYWSIAFALAHPERVRKLILIGAPAGIDKRIPPFLRLLGMPGINRFLSATIAKPSPKGIRDLFRRLLVANIDRVPDVFLECAYGSSILPGAKMSWLTMLENVITLRGFHPKYYVRKELKNLQRPTLFIWGIRTPSLPLRVAKRLAG